MSEALYRKYRSRTFSEVIGQDHIKSLLINSIKAGKIQHAYLFAGPRGTGKTSMARLMAKAVNLPDFAEIGDINPESESTKLVEEAFSLDVIEMDAASNRGIEEIRQIKENINYLPSRLKFKVYIIDEAHMLTKEAFNALLKTLEEPPSHIIIILATTEPHKLPVTILSRVQRYDFSLATKDQLKQKIEYILKKENIEYEEEVLDMIHEISGGSFRDAESLLSKLIGDGNQTLKVGFVKSMLGIISYSFLERLTHSIIEGNIDTSLATLEEIYSEISDFAIFIDQYLKYLKDQAISLLKNSQLDVLEKTQEIISELIKIKSELRDFDDAKMLVQIAIVKLCNNKLRITNYKLQIESSKEEPEDQIRSPKSEVPNKSQNPKIENPKSEIVNTPDPTSQTINQQSQISNPTSHIPEDDPIIKSIKQKAGDTSPRLKAILDSSIVIVKDGKFIIKNRYEFNLRFLKSGDVIKLLNEIFVELKLGDLIIEFGLMSDDEKVQAAEEESKNVEINAKIAQEEKKLVDNTNLVESILL